MEPIVSYKYNTAYPSIGKCIIINNKNFLQKTGMRSRTGTEKDGENLKKTFEDLGYNVKVFNDQTCNQIESCLLAVAQEDHSKEASFVCALLSHGDEGVLYGTDGCITMKKLTNFFGADYCATLVGKPKMFFIQACRGSGLDAGIEADSAEDDTHYNDFPKEPDFFYAYSTVPGYYSWRNISMGSWFVQSLCCVLGKYGKELELMKILTRVNYKVALGFESCSDTPALNAMKQIPCIASTLTNEFYF